MKILVTGGAGFIGSHLCKYLISIGNHVTCIDNFYTGSKKNLLAIAKNPNFKFIEADITKKINFKVDQIFNLACPASPVHYQKDPLNTIKTNTLGMINILENAYKNNSTVLQASTSEVYGDPLISPQEESYWGNVNPIGIRSCYDEGKRIAETMCTDFSKQMKINIKIARIFNTYGSNMQKDDGRVISNFFVQAMQNKDLTVYGDGNQTRSFCFIEDMLDGLVKLMNEKEYNINPVNLGNPEEFKVSDLAKIIIRLTKSKSKITYQNLPSDDPKIRKPDISLAKKRLDWYPKIQLLDGLRETESYFRSII
jgi:UDP-glucuronate decarboxylase